ncbi:SDR family oxidoreductase [Tropicibacter naphthalenivorans]|uniref:3-oxoacyl-[acyl-carrier-protein] reductase FabG n=1 Tax=Tropicibacter naphthalenivorans TaxID=441103 RepID=A0A0P1GG61_9RHOB|nr:SDR family oxidoreductase [Tropicibacter naphthalenivorans]CUH75387.1 3-oxoacyl-[acyl-carrier-protein] reductase FabG [Tropicibacter naphthalenivorans]SMC44699.1 NAD(P)-dependent dehydrogenase, short-chain alcohol dehydrogenase family [Tropicibacter naphthalenivorans]
MRNTKRALVTGGAKRLGRAMALDLAGQGYDVAVHYGHSAEAAEEVVAQIKAMGQGAVAVQADLLSEDATQALLPAAAMALGGPIHVLVNNASIFEYDTLDSATRDSWDRHMESNLRAPFVLTQALAAQVPDPVRDENDEPVAQGLVVNMIDQRVRKLTPEFMTYTIAKMGLWAMTQTTAMALAPRVRVNAIGPGPTLRGGRQTEDQFANQRAATQLERGANPGDICAALRYFLTAPAITGQLLCVDGGQHLNWQTPDVKDME